MPCYLVISIQVKDVEKARQAATAMGLEEGRDYTISGDQLSLENPSKEGQFKQTYGLLEVAGLARRKGFRTQRRTLQDGSIQLELIQ